MSPRGLRKYLTLGKIYVLMNITIVIPESIELFIKIR
ncbi:unnamed protein product [Onchocerca flexuosa]|uniref:Uncharacterized protein n=1 Tax=Onchocerca flexuosa TaxID=387005 RepID=A0A183GZX9_9BILA|nr:unnamed protein product [Onchocerca flexuosa]